MGWRARRVAKVILVSAPGSNFQKDDLPTELAKRLPHYPVPAAVIGRLNAS